MRVGAEKRLDVELQVVRQSRKTRPTIESLKR
jgi:hypothetical protein